MFRNTIIVIRITGVRGRSHIRCSVLRDALLRRASNNAFVFQLAQLVRFRGSGLQVKVSVCG